VYRYNNGWNWNAVVATVAGCALAWGGLVIPLLKPLYSYAWFVGFIVAGGVHYVLEGRRNRTSDIGYQMSDTLSRGAPSQ
jgi:NCS1 family nucleobase:cation symporter-1